MAPFSYKHRKTIVGMSAAVVLASLILSSQIKVDSDVMGYFKKSSEVRQDAEYFNDTYNGFSTLEIVLNSGKEGGIKEPEFLSQALNFQNYLEELTDTGKAYSVINFLRQINKVLHNGDPSSYVIPDSRELTAQFLLLYESSSPEEDLTDLKTFDEQYLRISVKLKNMPTSQAKQLIASIQKKMDADFHELRGVITGDTVLYVQMDSYILEGLAKSLLLAVGIIVICFFLLLRSIKYGLLSLIPSMFRLSLSAE